MKTLTKALQKTTRTDYLKKDLSAVSEDLDKGTVNVLFRQGRKMMRTTMLAQDIQPAAKYPVGNLPGHNLVD